jgi:hypothetical protein
MLPKVHYMKNVSRIGVFIFFCLCLVTTISLAATQRAAEKLLGETHKPLVIETTPDSKTEPKKKEIHPAKAEKTDPVQPHVTHKNKVADSQQTVVNSVQIELQDCHYNMNTQSVLCTFQLTGKQSTAEMVLYCFSGIGAVDANKNALQCNEVMVGQHRSWEYILTRLDMGVPAVAEINLQALSPVEFISELRMVLSINGQRQSIQMTNIAVH